MAGIVPQEDLPAGLSGRFVPESDLPSFGAPQKKPEEQGIFEAGLGALKRGFEQFGDIGAGYSLAGSQIVGDKQAAARKMEEAKADIRRQQQEVGGLSVADIERIYKEKGLVNAAGEVPQFLIEQVLQAAPTMATPLAVGAGVTALTAPFIGPAAPIAGGIAGIGTYGLQQFGSLMRRQAVEKERPEELSVGMAATGAALQAPIGYFADRFTAGLGGLGQKGVLEVGKELAARKAAGEIGALGVARGVGAQAAKGSALGFIAEAPTEALEQAIERWQAGLPLANDDAYNEYKEAFFGAGAVGVGVGGVSRGRTAYKGYKAGPEKEIPPEDLKPKEEGPLLLPAPAEIVANERNFDPLTNPLGNFFEGEITKDVAKYINKDRVENNKPKLKSFSLEDIVDALTYENLPTTTKQGYIDTLLTYKTGGIELDEKGRPLVYTSDSISNVAGQKNIDTGNLTGEILIEPNTKFEEQWNANPKLRTQWQSIYGPNAFNAYMFDNNAATGGVTFGLEGMQDFLIRTTGTNNLSIMTQPQLYSAFKSLSNMPAFSELTILEPETNAVRFTEKQYTNALKGLERIYDEINTDSLGRTSVINEIQQLTGLTRRGDAVALYNQAIQRGDLETELTVENVMGKPTNVVNVKFGGVQADLPQQFDIRKQAFKQRTEPEFYEIRNGNITINADKPIRTAEEAEAYLKKQEANYERLATDLESKGKDSVQGLQKQIQAREDQLDLQRALGKANTQQFKLLSAHLNAKNRADEAKIRKLQEEIARYRQPLKVVGVGEKPIVEDRYVYYEGDKPVAAFGTRAQAQEFGVTRMDETGLESLLTIAPEAKGASPKRLKIFAEQEKRKRQGQLPKGIEVTTTTKYRQEVVDKIRQLEKDLAPAMKRLGLDNVKLKIVDSIANGTADGAYVNSLIKIAYGAKDPMGTMRHEAIHALKELGAFTDAEWKALSNKAKSEWVDKYIKKPGLYKSYQDAYVKSYGSLKGFDEYVQEEAIAEAFREFANTQPPAGLIGQIFNRIKLFFEALRNTFTRAGFQTADSIFERVEKGEVRTKAVPAKPAIERFAKISPNEMEINKFYKINVEKNGIKKSFIGKLINQNQRLSTFEEYRKDGDLADRIQLVETNLIKSITPLEQDLMYGGFKTKEKLQLRAEERFAKKEGEKYGIPNRLWELFEKSERATAISSGRIPEGRIPRIAKREETMAARRFRNAVNEEFGEDQALNVMRRMAEIASIEEAVANQDTEALEIRKVSSPEAYAQVMGEERFQLRPPEPEKPRKIGNRLVGAPPGAGTEQARTALVKRMTNLLQHPYSMLEDSKDWYERSGQTIRDFARGNKDLMEKTVRLMALYSQANSLGGNTTATIKSLAQLASGQDTAYAGRFPNKTAQRIPAILAAKEFDTNLPGIDDKIMNFYQNLHDAAFNSNFFDNASTIDRWMMRLFGYPHSEDREQGGATGVSATQYKYAKDLLKRIAQKHFENTGEQLKPRQVQAVLWTYVKNTTDAEKAKKKGKEFKPSSMDFADYVKRATANITWEARPSTSLPIIPGIHTAPREQQESFNRAVREIFEEQDGESKVFKLLKSAVLYKSNASMGAYENKIVPNTVTQVVLQKDDDNNYIADIANKAAAIYGYVTRQDAVPWYRADPTISGKSASNGYKVTAEGIEPDAAFEDKLFKHLDKAMPGVGFTRVGNSFDFVNFRGENGKPFFMPDKKYATELQKALESFSGDVTFRMIPFRAESGYISNNWKENTNGEGYFGEFSPRELTDIRATLDDWRKAYDSLVEQYGREYGWDRPTEPTVRPSAEGRGVVLGTRQPGASSFTGRHFGKEKVDVLLGSMYGTGIKGAEAKRLEQTADPRIKNRVYFYVPNAEGKYPTKEAGLGANVYTQKFDNILGPGDLMSRLYNEANRDSNDFESMIVNQGFDGYALPDTGMMVILNHDVPVSFEGKEPDLRAEGRLQIRAPETPEFKKWFGDSKVVDKNGKPLLMYHGTSKDFDEFATKSKSILLGSGSYFTSDPVEADEYTMSKYPALYGVTKPQIIPVFLSIKNPYITDNKIDSRAREDDSIRKNYDGIIVVGKDGSIEWAVAFEPNQIKSAFNVAPTESSDVRYQIRKSVDPKVWGRVEATTTARKPQGFIERILTSIFPDSRADFRFKYINFLEGIERQTKEKAKQFGNQELLAENSAIASALQSLRAAGVAASSFRDGVPVYDKGYTSVSDLDGKVKGLIPILMPLAKYGDPDVYRLFQYYAATRRGRRLTAEGREQLFTPQDIQNGKNLETQYPEFKQVFDEYQLYNQGLVKFMRDTGVISDAEAKIWTQNWDYIPFYRQLEGEKTAGPKVFSALSGVSKPKELKGGTSELDDFMETIVRNARAAIESGMKNEAARRSVRDAMALGTAQELTEAESGPDIINVKIDGKTKYYRVADPLLVKSMQALNMPQLELISFLSKPAEILRNFVTKDPGFILANLGRDSLQAWITSGTKMTPVVDTFKEFGNQLFKQSPVASALARAGMTGYDFAGDVKSTSEEVAKALRKETGTRTGVERGLLPITALWDALEQGSHASDMATRIAVYKETLARTGSEAEAMYQAMEVLNFSRRGASPTVRMLAAMIPFLNARIQGLDVLYRSGWGQMATENKDVMKKAFAARALTMMGMSMMYWFLVSDEEEYKKLTKEERDNYWIVPGLEINGKPFRFPIPFELGVIFKVIPERVLETAFGSDTGKDLKESLVRQLTSTLQVNVPQAFLPILENVTNYSFFTGDPLVSRGLEDLEPKYQFSSGTSMMARDLGAALNISPIKIENLVRGYTGTLGTYAVQALDEIYRGQDDPVKATMRVEQYPVIKRFFASDSGTVSAYYDLKEQVDTAVRTVNMLERTGDVEGLRSYLEGSGKAYLAKDYVRAIEKDMKQIRDARKIINESTTMSPSDKREYLDRLHDMEVMITERVRMVKKEIIAR